MAEFMAWADEASRGGFGVRANADIPRDAKAARKFGAEGIGLCRTEHMFFRRGSHHAHMQAMILARDEKNRRKALLKLLPMQRKDFAGLFTAMDGFPVVIRTLDPPLHEFLPKREQLMVDLAKLPAADLKAKKEMVSRYAKLGATVKDLEEGSGPACWSASKNCTSSTRCSAIAAAAWGSPIRRSPRCEARAIFQEAAVQVAKKGIKVIPEVMIPLIGSTVEEFANQKADCGERSPKKCWRRPA